jgi:hypothetical protein
VSEGLDFWRRSWRHHKALAVAQLACGLGDCVTAVMRLVDGHSQWSAALALAFMAGTFVLWVMLVRRDEG